MKYLLTSIPFLLIIIFSCNKADGLLSSSGLSDEPQRSSLSLMNAHSSSFAWAGYTDTKGGTDGEVVRVTNLNNSGPGSFRHAVAEVTGPRLVVFDVGGVIDLEEERIRIRDPYLTVAGQTAPSPGITLIRGDIHIRTHDVILEHLAIRPGDAGHSKGSGWSPDGISTDSARDVIVRNCSITWAIDEGLTASGPRDPSSSKKISFINNIIAEGLHDSSHPKGPHSKGSTIINFVQDIAVIGNLYAHNDDRNPKFASDNLAVVVNNLIYNPGMRAISMSYSSNNKDFSNSKISVVGNYLQQGNDSHPKRPLVWAQVGNEGEAYVEDNLAYKADGSAANITNSEVIILDRKPTWPEGLVPLPADEVKEHVLSTVGARPWDRDEIDKRIIQSVLEQSGRIIDSQDEVGGYPDYTSTTRTLDVPDTNRQDWLYSLSTECGGSKDCIQAGQRTD